MSTAVTITLVVIAAMIAAVLGYAAMQSDTFTVQRAINIDAPSDKIYPLIADFRKWTQWSPYENRDPTMKRTYGGTANGVGASYAWDGDRNVGAGHMEITDASPSSKIEIKLDFNRPFEAHNIAEFTLAPEGQATRVTWAMRGPVPFIGKVMHLFFNMDRLVGGDFETGLAKLKSVSEQ